MMPLQSRLAHMIAVLGAGAAIEERLWMERGVGESCDRGLPGRLRGQHRMAGGFVANVTVTNLGDPVS